MYMCVFRYTRMRMIFFEIDWRARAGCNYEELRIMEKIRKRYLSKLKMIKKEEEKNKINPYRLEKERSGWRNDEAVDFVDE